MSRPLPAAVRTSGADWAAAPGMVAGADQGASAWAAAAGRTATVTASAAGRRRRSMAFERSPRRVGFMRLCLSLMWSGRRDRPRVVVGVRSLGAAGEGRGQLAERGGELRRDDPQLVRV